ncbi:MAG: hypothetical protein R3C60_07700 [Parvularculaceae bacterium]
MRCSVILAVLAAYGIGASAEAATLVHPSAMTHSQEKGVTVWRGAAVKKTPPPSLKGADPDCRDIRVVIEYGRRWPPRHLRTHKILDEADLGTPAQQLAYRPSTQGFWSDRMRQGY